VALLAAIGGQGYDLFEQLNLPRVPVNGQSLTTGGAIALGAALVTTLVFAVIGGAAGEAVPPPRRPHGARRARTSWPDRRVSRTARGAPEPGAPSCYARSTSSRAAAASRTPLLRV
jgi:hypothetical protein